jgi:hypothetical protein
MATAWTLSSCERRPTAAALLFLALGALVVVPVPARAQREDAPPEECAGHHADAALPLDRRQVDPAKRLSEALAQPALAAGTVPVAPSCAPGKTTP